MKEPLAVDGIVSWNYVRVADTFIAELKSYGYQWNEVEECYQMPVEKLRHWNNPGTRLDPISFHVDEFYKITHR